MKNWMLTLLVFFSTAGFANDMNQKAQTRTLSNSIISNFVESDFDSGIEKLRPHWPLPEVELDGLLNQINTQWPIVEQRFGKAVGSEFVKEEYIGDSFVRYYYLHKFQNHSIYWRISFYKPNGKWVANGITFLDTLDTLYQVAE